MKERIMTLKNVSITINKSATGDTEQNKESASETYLSACSICGQEHDTKNCLFFHAFCHVKDEPLVSRARQTLPKNLEITRMADDSFTIVAKQDFQQGTTFGPFQAKRDWAMNPMNDFPIKVFGDGKSDTYHLDYSDEETSNWMCFVSPASNAREQNLICYQLEKEIFYTAMRLILSGEELRVWYAPSYALKMKMPLYNMEFANIGATFSVSKLKESSTMDENTKIDETEVSNKSLEETTKRSQAEQLGAPKDKTNWNCKICSIVIASVNAYAKHLMEHYKPFLGVFCDICNKKFYRLSVLQKHKRLKHPEIVATSDVVGIPTSENQQQQNAQTILMNMSDSENQTSEAMKDILEKFKAGKAITESTLLSSMETEKETQNELPLLDTNSINVNDLLQNNGTLSMENSSSLKSILENQCLNMNLGLGTMSDSILSENITGVDSVKFNVEEFSSELLDITPDVENINRRVDNLECDICEKKFEKADYLHRHLRKHTGEFTCSECSNVFARKENLVSHICPWQKPERRNYECLYCQKRFVMKKYLKRHMVKHTGWNTCKWCRSLFDSRLELEAHKCQAPNHVCSQCGKRFVHRAHLNRHTKSHANPKPVVKRKRKSMLIDKPVICEKCGDVFKNPHNLNQHLRSHGEKLFECDVCHSRFHRIGVLKQHKAIHQTIQIPCQVCGKKLKSKKALSVHVLLHGNKKFDCEKCDKSFFQRCNYLKHYKQVHSDKVTYKCPHCPTQFTNEQSFNKHVESHVKPAQHSCSSCHKVFHREYQLKRHVQTNHSGIIFRCPYCKMTARYRHSMRRHFERQHKSLSDDWDKPGFVNDLIERTSPTLIVDQVVATNRDNAVMQVAYGEVNTAEFETHGNAQGLILSVAGLEEDRYAHETKVQTQSVENLEQSSLNGEEILLQVSDSTIASNELPSNEVPQLSISDSDAHLAESVLGNAYIFGEDGGDIMFYVLDNTPVITDY